MKRAQTYLALLMVFALGAAARAKPASIGVAATSATHYLWRGYDVLGGAAYPVQPSATLSLAGTGISTNIWGSFALKDRARTRAGDEVDFTLTYTRALTPLVTLSMGGIYYHFPNGSDLNTSEVYLGASLEVPLNPSVTIYYDNTWLDRSGFASSGWYALFGAGRAFPLGIAPLEVAATAGFASNDAFTGLQDVTFAASTDLTVANVRIVPFVAGAYIAQERVNPDSFELYGGVTVETEF